MNTKFGSNSVESTLSWSQWVPQCCFCWSAMAPVKHWLGRRRSVRLFLETQLSPVKLKSNLLYICVHVDTEGTEHRGRRKALHSSLPDGRVWSQTRGPQSRKIHRSTETYCTYCTWRHTWKITSTQRQEGSQSPHNTENQNSVPRPYRLNMIKSYLYSTLQRNSSF